MEYLNQRNPTIKLKEPSQNRIGSRSMEEVREMALTPTFGSSDSESNFTAEGDEDKRSISSPKPTFTSQDSHGNINQLNLLIAPFDPNWLEPTPQLMRRALSAQFYYDDLKTQMASNPRDLFPRPQSQQGYSGYPGDPSYLPNGQPQQPFQSFAQAQQSYLHQQAPPNGLQPLNNTHLLQQYPQQQQQPNLSGIPPNMPFPTNQPHPTQIQPHFSIPPQQPWGQSPGQTNAASYQPHNVPNQRQSSIGRSKMDNSGNSKYMSLPSRNQIPPQQLQMLRNTGGPLSSPQLGSMVGIMPQTGNSQPCISPTIVSSLGPATGYMPNTYSQEHQRVITNQLPQPAPVVTQAQPHHGLGTLNNAQHRTPEMQRPDISHSYYATQPPAAQTQVQVQQSSSTPIPTQLNNTIHNGGQPIYSASPIQQSQQYPQQQQQQKCQQQQQQQQQQYQPTVAYQHPNTSSFSEIDSFNTMHKSPALPMPTNIPAKARELIFSHYMPRAVIWEGNDIKDGLTDRSIGRRIMSRYALGMAREKYVREGFYTKDKSPLLGSGQVRSPFQHQQQQQSRTLAQRQLQRQFSMDKGGNDRVILKWLKSKREWEVDCVMMRYLTCQHPEEKLESQYSDYAQPQQDSQAVNPFVVGLYETFMHPHGTDYEGCRYLSVMQWYPETLQQYIEDSIASGEGLEVTLPIVWSLIECVQWIHGRKVCHLNIKPSNFVRDPYMASTMKPGQNGNGWKLVDFEAARIMDEETVGRCTFSYAAPEILIRNASATGVVAKGSLDIWSLGLVIYELLTDQPLFKTDDHAKDVLLGTRTNGIEPVRYYDVKNIPPEYHQLLDSMLAYDPEKRLSASELLRLDIFTRPISPRPVTQELLIRNNSILSLRDLKATRLCNLKGGQSSFETEGGGGADNGGGPNSHGSNGSSSDSAYGSLAMSSSSQHQMMLLEGIGRILDSPFDQVPRLFMILPPMRNDLTPSEPFLPTNLLQNKNLRLVLLCEGLSGYGEDAHVTDHRGYILQEPTAFVQDVGKLMLHLVAVAGTNNPGYETSRLDRPLALTGTPLDNCQRWYSSLRSYYEALQTAVQYQVGPAPGLNELRSLRGPTLKALEQWLGRLVRRQCQLASEKMLGRKPTVAGQGDLVEGHGEGYNDLSDRFGASMRLSNNGNEDKELELEEVDQPEVTGPGGGEGYGGLYKMPVGTCGDRWICRGCVRKQMAMVAAGSNGMKSEMIAG
ncbi:hypothetical protein BCR41DRAFT_348435 [Lobosporangium transversale]|uniref:Protein kinase domain-containing protein n=1 Tax=Lobosporangium transversale TaxID=64571 RepID=A0A1Y2GW34_9FUNG|nr:hypothetical protein BCR41DRAFT_348435 [Lobosporangium transversale]ORZ26520.1 hypothetical protein BCR41DRAFT_348435 [Lobosporangium transversale]|eukprot:XP_021884285.1 hypothetical protein BCR41DRAFT_348435 [Lobosporangium transversale]